MAASARTLGMPDELLRLADQFEAMAKLQEAMEAT